MYQKAVFGKTRCFYFNDKIKEDIFIILCQLHKRNQEKIHKFMFILLHHEFIWYMLCGYFMSSFWNFVTILSLTVLKSQT